LVYEFLDGQDSEKVDIGGVLSCKVIVVGDYNMK